MHSVSEHRCYVPEQYHEIDRRIVNVNDLPKRSTEGERSLIKHFVRSLSMPHELSMSVRNFFEHGQVGNWLGQANSVTCLPLGQAGIQVFFEPCILSKFPYWEILFRTGAYHLQKSLPFTKKFI